MMLLASALFFGCSDDDDLNIQGGVDIPQEVDLMNLEKWSYEVPFDVKSDSEWRIETTGDFCYAMPAEGTGNATVKLCIIDNDEENRLDGELRIIFPRDEKKNITLKMQQKYAGDYDANAETLDVGNRVYAVGYGYNTTGGYANPESVKRPILKFADMVHQELIVLGSVNANFNIHTYSSSSIEQLSNDLATKANVNGSFGKFKSEVTGAFNSNYFSSNNYEYALTFIDLAIRNANVEADLDQMRDTTYMTAAAYKAINGLTPTYADDEGIKRLIKDYGTHLCISARLGGRIRHSMAVDISKVTDAYDISAYAEASYDGLFVSGGGSVDEKFKKSFSKNTNACNIQVNVLGGEQAAAMNLSSKLSEANLNTWKASVNAENMALVAFNESSSDPSLIPLYELVDRAKYGDRYDKIHDYITGEEMAKDYPSIGMSYDCGTITRFAVPEFSEEGTLVKQVKIDGHVVAQVCEEYIPVINKDERVKVIYPVINNKPRHNMGLFIGNDTHRPARVAWEGTSLAVREYSDMEMGELDTVLIKGASITPIDTLKKPVEGTVIDEYMEGYRGNSNGNYPIVKIFNNYWMREDYRGEKFRDGSDVSGDYYETYANYVYARYEKLSPAGWRIPTKKELESIRSTLVSNGLTQIGKEFYPGGKLGFCAENNGWADVEYIPNALRFKKHYGDTNETHYPVKDESGKEKYPFFIIEKNGGFSLGAETSKGSPWSMPVRFVKE